MENNKVVLSTGEVVMDITDTTATENDVLSGKTFYKANGTRSTGAVVTTPVDEHYGASSTNAQAGTAVAEAIATKQDSLSKDTTNPDYYVNAGIGADTVQLATKAYVDSKDPFMLLDFSQSVSGTLLPVTSDTAISGASTGRIDITVPEQYQDEWAIASIAKWEIKNGSTRVDAFPMYSFSMNGQKTMRVGYRTSGTTNKSFTTIAGAMLLKHR